MAKKTSSPTPDVSRIGSVPFLNAQPLVYGLGKKLHTAVPSELASDLFEKRIDVGLIPVAEYLEHPIYTVLPGMSISCRGPVKSVYLAYEGDLSAVRRVALDPNSRTSNLLWKVLATEYLELRLQYVDSDQSEAQVLIGDEALLQRDTLIEEGLTLLDLGGLWWQKTGLPFVFAFWAARPGVAPDPYFKLLADAKEKGLQSIDAIVASEKRLPGPEVRKYLKQSISYEFGAEELRGLEKFQELCLRYGFISKASEIDLFDPSHADA